MLRPDSSSSPSTRPFFASFPPLQLILLGLALFFLQQLLLELTHAIVQNLFVAVTISWAGAMVLPPLWIAARHPEGFLRAYRFFPLPLSQAGWLVLVTVGLVFASDLLGQLNTRWVQVPDWVQTTTEQLTPEGPADWMLAVMSLCVVVPLGEEILFRGLIQQATRQAYRGVVAAGFAGLLFGALHLQPWFLLPLCLVGIVLGLVYEVTGTLAGPILVHALYNAAVLANEALQPADTDAVRDVTTMDTLIAAAALTAGVLAFGRLRRSVPWANDLDGDASPPASPSA